MKKIDPVIVVNGWNVYQEPHGFYCANNGKTLFFEAEYRNGTYFKIKSYFDGKRAYQAQKYHYKLIPLVHEITFELLKKDVLWDYKNDCPALKTYKRDIYPYYAQCKEKNIDPGLFLTGLFE